MAAIIGLHQTRPEEGAIRLDRAWFTTGPRDRGGAVSLGSMVRLPHDWRHEGVGAAEGWYRFELDLDVAPDRLWALYVPALEMTPAAFVNGTAIGGHADPGQPLPRYWNRPIIYSVPNGLLLPGVNHVDVELRANGPWGRLTEVYLGPREDLQPSFERRSFWRVTFLNVTTVASLMLALFMFALSAASRDRVYLWFGAFAFAWYLQNVFFLTVWLPVSNALWDFFAYAIIGIMVATASIFAFRFLGEPHRRWERFILAAAVAGPALLAAMLLAGASAFNVAGSLIWVGVLLALAAYPAVLIVRSLLEHPNAEKFFLCVCFVLALSLGAHDWLVTSGIGYRHNGMLMQFAAAPTLATLGIILLRRFVAALRETEALNRSLEQRVAEKAREIETTFARNRELESSQLLSRERERIMRDMHDGVGSQLIGMMGHLDVADARDQELIAELNVALHDLRMMIDSLEEVDNDVVVALGLFRNRIQPQLDASGLTLHWQVGDLPLVADLGPERVLHFLRLLQESVTNCIKHARARNLTISTSPEMVVSGRRCVCVTVLDDGQGFAAASGSGRGLANMRYRARAADLVLAVESGAWGTKVRIGFSID